MINSQKYKNKRKNYSYFFIALGGWKPLPCFPLDTDINDILNYPQTICYVNVKKNRSNMGLLGHVHFDCNIHEISINYDSQLVTLLRIFQVLLLAVTLDHRGHFTSKFVKWFIYLSPYHVLKDFHVCNWLFNYDTLKNSVILAISLILSSESFLKYCWRIK